jgi:hypothetical protein
MVRYRAAKKTEAEERGREMVPKKREMNVDCEAGYDAADGNKRKEGRRRTRGGWAEEGRTSTGDDEGQHAGDESYGCEVGQTPRPIQAVVMTKRDDGCTGSLRGR